MERVTNTLAYECCSLESTGLDPIEAPPMVEPLAKLAPPISKISFTCWYRIVVVSSRAKACAGEKKKGRGTFSNKNGW